MLIHRHETSNCFSPTAFAAGKKTTANASNKTVTQTTTTTVCFAAGFFDCQYVQIQLLLL